MKKLWLLLLLCSAAAAQTTSVTATLTDSDGTAWANGTCTAQWIGFGQPVDRYGQPFNAAPACAVDGSGNLSVSVEDIAYVLSTGSTWKFCATPYVTQPRTWCTQVAATGASQDISTQIQAVMQPPRITGGTGSHAYVDVEVSAFAGNQYFRTSDSTFRCYTTAWGGCGGGGAGSVTSVGLTNALTMNNAGTGAASGSTFNGSAGVTLSYNTIGASPLAGSTSLTTLGTVTTGAWSATTIGLTKGGSGATTAATALSNFLGNPAAGTYSINCASGTSCATTVAGSGTVNTGTSGQFAYYATSTNAVSGNSRLDDGGTNPNTLTYSGGGGMAAQKWTGTGSGPSVLQLAAGTFATLTATYTCNGTNEGMMATVSDSNIATWGSTVAGGGTNVVLAFCDGTNWTVAGK